MLEDAITVLATCTSTSGPEGRVAGANYRRNSRASTDGADDKTDGLGFRGSSVGSAASALSAARATPGNWLAPARTAAPAAKRRRVRFMTIPQKFWLAFNTPALAEVRPNSVLLES